MSDLARLCILLGRMLGHCHDKLEADELNFIYDVGPRLRLANRRKSAETSTSEAGDGDAMDTTDKEKT